MYVCMYVCIVLYRVGRNALTQSGAALASTPSGDTADAFTSVISPESDEFSGFVFKLQANLDPKHRSLHIDTCPVLYSPYIHLRKLSSILT